MQPDHSLVLLNAFLPALRNEHGITKKVIEAIPVDKGDYRPDEISKTALDLAWHIVATEMRFLEAVTAAQFDFTPRPRPAAIVDSASLAAWYATEFASHADAVAQLSGDHLTKLVDFRGLFQLPVVMYLDFVHHHSVHHRGQLSMYLRPMGAKVPAIYGESYDSAQARKAAQ